MSHGATPPDPSNAEILAIWISPGHDFAGRHGQERLENGIVACDQIECVAGSGLRGDRYFDHKEDYKGQLTLIAKEVIDDVCQAIDQLEADPAAFRRNILTQGLDLNALIGQRFRLEVVELSGSEECKPCHWMDTAIGPGAHASLKDRGGLRCRIIRSGLLNTGGCNFEVLGPILTPNPQ